MRVLLTGHKGYIGTVMTPMLPAAGEGVVGLDSDVYRRCTYSAGGRIADVRQRRSFHRGYSRVRRQGPSLLAHTCLRRRRWNLVALMPCAGHR
jgi:nucleoside-diphosphate-sugar epimerase